MKKNISRIAVLLVAMVSTIGAMAQGLERNDLIYNSQILPQTNRLNPAVFQQNRSAFVSLPSFNISLGLPVAYKDFTFKEVVDNGDTKYKIDIYDLTQHLNDNKSIHVGTEINLLGFGFRVKKMFLTFNAGAVVDAALGVPTELANIINGNLYNSIGRENATNVSFSNLAHLNAYEKFQIGLGFDVLDNLSIGAHVNILNGLVNLSLTDANISIYSSDETFSTLYADMSYKLRRAGCLQFDFDGGDTEFAHTFNNIGYTFDLGARYKIGGLSVSASLLDIGPGITWKDNVKYTEPIRNDVKFEGYNLGNLLDGGNIDAGFFDDVTEELEDMLKTQDVEGEEYTTRIPAKVYLGANYDFNSTIRASLLFHGEWDKGISPMDGYKFGMGKDQFRYNVSLSAGVNLLSWLELMVANAFCFDGENGSMINPGAGITIAPFNTLQIYVMADYISSFYVAEMKSANMQFGINYVFGKKQARKKVNDVPELLEP